MYCIEFVVYFCIKVQNMLIFLVERKHEDLWHVSRTMIIKDWFLECDIIGKLFI
jgi:hypothetical protein